MSISKANGTNCEGAIMARLIKAGKVVLFPVGNNERYDLVVDHGDRFERIQCKLGRIEGGCVKFETASTNLEAGKWTHKNYCGQVETLAVYCPENDSVYLIPISELGKREGSLRLQPTRNGQQSGIRWASKFEL